MSDDATVVLRLSKADAQAVFLAVDRQCKAFGINMDDKAPDIQMLNIWKSLQAALAAPAADAGTGDSLEAIGWANAGPGYDGSDIPTFEEQ